MATRRRTECAGGRRKEVTQVKHVRSSKRGEGGSGGGTITAKQEMNRCGRLKKTQNVKNVFL